MGKGVGAVVGKRVGVGEDGKEVTTVTKIIRIARQMKKIFFILLIFFIFIGTGSAIIGYLNKDRVKGVQSGGKKSYWFVLHRKSNAEYLYYGESGNEYKSDLVRIF